MPRGRASWSSRVFLFDNGGRMDIENGVVVELDAALASGDRQASEWLHGFINSDRCREWIAFLCRQVLSGGRAQPVLRDGSLTLCHGPGWTLDVMRIDAAHALGFSSQGPILSSLESDSILAVMGDASVSLVEHRLHVDGWLSLPRQSLIESADVVVVSHIHLQAATPAFHEFISDRPFHLGRIRHGFREPLTWRMSRDGVLLGSYMSCPSDALALNLTRHYAAERSRSSLDQLHELACHPCHMVRWSAMQAVARIDGSMAMVLIRKAVDDPHPGVRSAARRVIEKRAA